MSGQNLTKNHPNSKEIIQNLSFHVCLTLYDLLIHWNYLAENNKDLRKYERQHRY